MKPANFFPRRSRRFKRNRGKQCSSTLRGESLENRQMLTAVVDSALDPVLNDGTLRIEGRDATENFAFVTSPDQDIVRVTTWNNQDQPRSVDFAREDVNLVVFVGGDLNDLFSNNTDIRSNAKGGHGDDTLIGGSERDQFFAGPGHDTIVGHDGPDWLNGGDGDDVIDGGEGNDDLVGGKGDDSITGGGGDDTIVGNNGADRIFGNEGDDTLSGSNGHDAIDAGPGNDVVNGDAGDDTLVGGTGDDDIYGGDGRDIVYGGEGANNVDGGLDVDQFVVMEGDLATDIDTEDVQVTIEEIDQDLAEMWAAPERAGSTPDDVSTPSSQLTWDEVVYSEYFDSDAGSEMEPHQEGTGPLTMEDGDAALSQRFDALQVHVEQAMRLAAPMDPMSEQIASAASLTDFFRDRFSDIQNRTSTEISAGVFGRAAGVIARHDATSHSVFGSGREEAPSVGLETPFSQPSSDGIADPQLMLGGGLGTIANEVENAFQTGSLVANLALEPSVANALALVKHAMANTTVGKAVEGATTVASSNDPVGAAVEFAIDTVISSVTGVSLVKAVLSGLLDVLAEVATCVAKGGCDVDSQGVESEPEKAEEEVEEGEAAEEGEGKGDDDPEDSTPTNPVSGEGIAPNLAAVIHAWIDQMKGIQEAPHAISYDPTSPTGESTYVPSDAMDSLSIDEVIGDDAINWGLDGGPIDLDAFAEQTLAEDHDQLLTGPDGDDRGGSDAFSGDFADIPG